MRLARPGDGRQMVEVCRPFVPDLVITDDAMPGLDGLAAAQQINGDRTGIWG